MAEIWKEIPGYPDYRISSFGRVKSIRRKKLLKPCLRKGYPKVALQKGGIRKDFNIHRLVLLAFVGPLAAGFHCSHKNGNRLNNKLSNLKYETPKENMARRWKHGTQIHGEQCHAHKLTESKIRTIRNIWKNKKRRMKPFIADIAKEFNITRQGIWRIVTKRQWAHTA